MGKNIHEGGGEYLFSDRVAAHAKEDILRTKGNREEGAKQGVNKQLEELPCRKEREREEDQREGTKEPRCEGSDDGFGDEHEEIGEDVNQSDFVGRDVELLLEEENLLVRKRRKKHLNRSKPLVDGVHKKKVGNVENECRVQRDSFRLSPLMINEKKCVDSLV